MVGKMPVLYKILYYQYKKTGAKNNKWTEIANDSVGCGENNYLWPISC